MVLRYRRFPARCNELIPVGPDWYWYSEPVYPYPDPYLPPGATPGYWYYCDFYRQYYPYVGACPSGWRAVPAQ
jgi:hypothetical protein